MIDFLSLPGLRQLADVVLIGLLGATLAYVRRLERNLDRLRGDRTAFERMLDGFAERTGQAETALKQFQVSSDVIHRELKAQIEVAAMLRHDLAATAIRAEMLLRDLDAVSTPPAPSLPAPTPPGRARTTASRPVAAEEPARTIPADDAFDDRPRSRAERDLLHALRGTR